MEDHFIKFKDMVVRTKSGEGRKLVVYRRLERVQEVVLADIRVLTGKTTNKDCFNSEGRVIGRGLVWESLLLEDLCEYMNHSQIKSEDEFLARY